MDNTEILGIHLQHTLSKYLKLTVRKIVKHIYLCKKLSSPFW